MNNNHNALDDAPYDVVFVIAHLGPGGAQKVLTEVANHLSAEGKHVLVITWHDGKPDAHRLDPQVDRINARTLKNFTYHSRQGSNTNPVIKPTSRCWSIDVMTMRYILRRYVRYVRYILRRYGGPEVYILTRIALLPVFKVMRNLFKVMRNLFVRIAMFSLNMLVIVCGEISYFARSKFYLNIILSKALGDRIGNLREAIRASRTSVVVSLLTKTNIQTLIATRELNCRVIVSERNDPDRQHLEPFWERLRRYLYPEAQFVTSNSKGVLDKLSAYVPSEKLALLPNPLTLHSSSTKTKSCNRFVTVTRLVPQKGIDVLIDAYKLIASDLTGWHLDVIGDGPLLDELRALTSVNSLENHVTFHGHCDHPWTYLQRSKIFVLPSRFEGMPNALLEAMGSGLAPIVTDASPGPLEMVENGKNGLVVPVDDARKLAAAMKKLATDTDLATLFGSQSKDRVSELTWEKVGPIWKKILGI